MKGLWLQEVKANSEDCMTLSTITQNDSRPKARLYFKPDCASLQTRDIEGAQPRLPGYRFVNKPEYANITRDIERAHPSKLHPYINRPEFRLMTKDIEFAQPSSKEFKTNRIGHNPLVPVYNLPKFEVRPITPPRFIRDSINPTDIEGTKSNSYFKWCTRDSIGVKDIDGARPKPEKVLKKPDLIDPKDINNEWIFRSKRSVNPLVPEYAHRDEEGRLAKIGFVDGSRPKVLVRTATVPHTRHLISCDIDGARTGTVGVGPLGTRVRKNARSPTDISDIEGANAGSLRRRMTHTRIISTKQPSEIS